MGWTSSEWSTPKSTIRGIALLPILNDLLVLRLASHLHSPFFLLSVNMSLWIDSMELQLLMTRCMYLAEITMDVTLMIFRYGNYFRVGIWSVDKSSGWMLFIPMAIWNCLATCFSLLHLYGCNFLQVWPGKSWYCTQCFSDPLDLFLFCASPFVFAFFPSSLLCFPLSLAGLVHSKACTENNEVLTS